MKQYHDLLWEILDQGTQKGDRTGTGTLSLFGYQMRFNLREGFPLATTKKVFWRGVVEELLWMIRGETNVKSLQEKGINIWNEWANKKGELGPVYGKQWRKWETPDYLGQVVDVKEIDQLKEVIERIKVKPDCRRLIVTAWNPGDVAQMKLPSCHCFFQFYVLDGKLSTHMYQRSADVFLGVPFNIASYALLTHIIANICGLEVGDFIHTFGDVHIYNNHVKQVKTQLDRPFRKLPRLCIKRKFKNIDDNLVLADFDLQNYDPAPAIWAEVSV